MSEEFEEGPSRFETMYDNAVKELRIVKDDLAIMLSLQEHPGWKKYRATLEEQAEQRSENFSLTPVTGIDELVGREFPRGEQAGLRLALDLLDVFVSSLKTQVDGLQAEVDRFAAIEEGEE